MESHPLLAGPEAEASVRVYFIRPDPGFIGVEGNAFEVSLAGEPLLTLAKGEYTLVYLKPWAGEVVVGSSSMVSRGGVNSQAWVEATGRLSLDETCTCYVSFMRHYDERLKGITYRPFLMSRDEAKKMVNGLKAVGFALNEPF